MLSKLARMSGIGGSSSSTRGQGRGSRMDAAVVLPPMREGTRCVSCGQTPRDTERDLLPEKEALVHWSKKGKDSSGQAGRL